KAARLLDRHDERAGGGIDTRCGAKHLWRMPAFPFLAGRSQSFDLKLCGNQGLRGRIERPLDLNDAPVGQVGRAEYSGRSGRRNIYRRTIAAIECKRESRSGAGEVADGSVELVLFVPVVVLGTGWIGLFSHRDD